MGVTASTLIRTLTLILTLTFLLLQVGTEGDAFRQMMGYIISMIEKDKLQEGDIEPLEAWWGQGYRQDSGKEKAGEQ